MLKLENMTIRFDNKRIFENTSFCVYPNEITVITGNSGSGKTTLLDVIAQQKTYDVDYTFNHQQIDDSFKKNIYYIKQTPVFIESLTIQEQLLLTLEIHHKELDIDEYHHFVSLFKMKNKMDKYPKQLSGGEKQKAALIIALCRKANLYLMDEPTASLDLESVQVFIQLLKEMKDSYIIITAHDQDLKDKAGRWYEIADYKLVLKREKSCESKMDLNDTIEISYKQGKLLSQRLRYNKLKNSIYFLIMGLFIGTLSFTFGFNPMVTQALNRQTGRLESTKILVYKGFVQEVDYTFYNPLTEREIDHLYKQNGLKNIYGTFWYSNSYNLKDDVGIIDIYNKNGLKSSYDFQKQEAFAVNISIYDPKSDYDKDIIEDFLSIEEGVYISSFLKDKLDIEEGDSISLDIFIPQMHVKTNQLNYYEKNNIFQTSIMDYVVNGKVFNVNPKTVVDPITQEPVSYETKEAYFADGISERVEFRVKGILNPGKMGVGFNDHVDTVEVVYDEFGEIIDTKVVEYTLYIPSRIMNELINQYAIKNENSYHYPFYILDFKDEKVLRESVESLENNGFDIVYDSVNLDWIKQENQALLDESQRIGMIVTSVFGVILLAILYTKRKDYENMNDYFRLQGLNKKEQSKMMMISLIVESSIIGLLSIIAYSSFTLFIEQFIQFGMSITLSGVILTILFTLFFSVFLPECIRKGMSIHD